MTAPLLQKEATPGKGEVIKEEKVAETIEEKPQMKSKAAPAERRSVKIETESQRKEDKTTGKETVVKEPETINRRGSVPKDQKEATVTEKDKAGKVTKVKDSVLKESSNSTESKKENNTEHNIKRKDKDKEDSLSNKENTLKEDQHTDEVKKHEKEEKDDEEQQEQQEQKEQQEQQEQQGVKRRLPDDTTGSTTCKSSRLEDLELLASLSSSQPGLLKREREEEDEDEEEGASGEPDSKKLNTVEELERSKQIGAKKKEQEKEDETEKEDAVEAVSKLRDAELEASFSSSRSQLKVEKVELVEEVKEVIANIVPHPAPTPAPIFSLLPPSPSASPVKEISQSPSKKPVTIIKDTTQTIGAKELKEEKNLNMKRLNKFLTIFKDQSRMIRINLSEDPEVQETPIMQQSFLGGVEL